MTARNAGAHAFNFDIADQHHQTQKVHHGLRTPGFEQSQHKIAFPNEDDSEKNSHNSSGMQQYSDDEAGDDVSSVASFNHYYTENFI